MYSDCKTCVILILYVCVMVIYLESSFLPSCPNNRLFILQVPPQCFFSCEAFSYMHRRKLTLLCTTTERH